MLVISNNHCKKYRSNSCPSPQCSFSILLHNFRNKPINNYIPSLVESNSGSSFVIKIKSQTTSSLKANPTPQTIIHMWLQIYLTVNYTALFTSSPFRKFKQSKVWFELSTGPPSYRYHTNICRRNTTLIPVVSATENL